MEIDALTMILVTHQASLLALENQDRLTKFSYGQQVAESLGKPYLVVGRVKHSEYPCADVVLDTDPKVIETCDTGVIANVTNIPYPDKFFGCAFASHILEHLTQSEAEQAWKELWRVADHVIVAFPSKLNLVAVLHPDHKLWINWDENDPEILYIKSRI